MITLDTTHDTFDLLVEQMTMTFAQSTDPLGKTDYTIDRED